MMNKTEIRRSDPSNWNFLKRKTWKQIKTHRPIPIAIGDFPLEDREKIGYSGEL